MYMGNWGGTFAPSHYTLHPSLCTMVSFTVEDYCPGDSATSGGGGGWRGVASVDTHPVNEKNKQTVLQFQSKWLTILNWIKLL